MYWQETTAPVSSVLATTNPPIRSVDTATESFMSVSLECRIVVDLR